MKLFFLSGIFFLIYCATTSSPVSSQDSQFTLNRDHDSQNNWIAQASAEDRIERGLKFREAKNYQSAIEEFTAAIELDPRSAQAYKLRGWSYFNLGSYDQAIKDLDQAIKLDPKDRGSFNLRGMSYRDSNENERAIDDFTQAIRIDPDWPPPYQNRGLAYINLKRYQEAIEDYNISIPLDSDRAYKNFAYKHRGWAYYELGDYTNALDDLNKQISTGPQDSGSFNLRGLVYLEINEYEKAAEDFSKAIDLQPTNAKAFANRALAYHALGNTTDSLSDINEASKIDPSDDYTKGVRAKIDNAPSSIPPDPKLDKQLYSSAESSTVLIYGINPGTGVIIKREGNIYTVLTAAHVVETPDEYDIITHDEKKYPLDYSTVVTLSNVDLAILKFESAVSYPVIPLGNSDTLTLGDKVHVAGYTAPSLAMKSPFFAFTSGDIVGIELQDNGYEIIYDNSTRPGMSGGPVLNTNGELIGIHGRGDILDNVGGSPDESGGGGKTGFNLGIAINTFIKWSEVK